MTMELIEHTQCPDANTLAAFVEMKLLGREYEDVFLHIAGCSTCRDLCRFAMEMSAKDNQSTILPEQDKANILAQIRKTAREANGNGAKAPWSIFVRQMTVIFNQLEHAEIVAAGDTDSVISFSAQDAQGALKWRMNLFIPTQATTTLRIQMVEPWRGNGTLFFCGNRLNVVNGETEIAYDTLKESFDNPEVAFVFKDGKKVFGYPELI